ncbi:MAG TPA: glycosyltransferase family 4 protein [Gammaproteobacteria bacterium]|nr:glycosyltransferase family 4 protein [Gammaproteobacteria bacterium]
MTFPRVVMLCQFGQPVRGVSPYGDALLSALRNEAGDSIQAVDYYAPYPAVLHPAGRDIPAGPGKLHWSNPLSWYRVASLDTDILHMQHWVAPMAVYLAPLATMARHRDKRILITCHNPSAHETFPGMEFIENRLLNQADAIIAHDTRGAGILEKRVDTTKHCVHIIPHGIEISEAPPAAAPDDYERFGLVPERRYICIFGNLRGYKGIDILLEAWPDVCRQSPDIDLVIAGRLWSGKTGTGSRVTARLLGTEGEGGRLHELLARPEIAGRVHLHDAFQSERNINALLRLSAFAVFPYVRFSSQSGAACKAAGMGCPVLVSDVGGLPDLAISREWIVPPGNVEKLASTLTARLVDIEKKEDLRMQQLRQAEQFSWPRVARLHADIYRKLCE